MDAEFFVSLGMIAGTFMSPHFYLSNVERVTALREYKYKGADTSLIYKFVLSPLSQFCVDVFVPAHVAPNVITLLGLLFSLLAACVTLLYNPTLLPSSESPKWLPLLTGVCIFLYQTLDNMDGKQARKTQSSSPLGLLFDHGCDAINAGLLAIPMASVLGVGWSMGIFFSLWCGFVPFYFSTWEEHYMDEMILPIINGPTEGLLIACGMCVATYLRESGSAMWHEPCIDTSSWFILPDAARQGIAYSINLLSSSSSSSNSSSSSIVLTPFQFMCINAVVGALITVTASAAKVLRHVHKNRVLQQKLQKDSSSSPKDDQAAPTVAKALLDLLPFFVFFPSVFCWCLWSKIALQTYPLVSLLLMSSTFVEMTTHIMFSHVTRGDISPLQRYTSLLTLLLPLRLLYPDAMLPKLFTEARVLFVLTSLSFTFTFWALFGMCTETAEALRIYVFKQGLRNDTPTEKSKKDKKHE